MNDNSRNLVHKKEVLFGLERSTALRWNQKLGSYCDEKWNITEFDGASAQNDVALAANSDDDVMPPFCPFCGYSIRIIIRQIPTNSKWIDCVCDTVVAVDWIERERDYDTVPHGDRRMYSMTRYKNTDFSIKSLNGNVEMYNNSEWKKKNTNTTAWVRWRCFGWRFFFYVPVFHFCIVFEQKYINETWESKQWAWWQ